MRRFPLCQVFILAQFDCFCDSGGIAGVFELIILERASGSGLKIQPRPTGNELKLQSGICRRGQTV